MFTIGSALKLLVLVKIEFEKILFTNTNINSLKEAYMQTSAPKIQDITKIINSKER